MVPVILTASTGETDEAIRTGFRMDSLTVISITRAVITANLTVFGKYQPARMSRYPMILPITIPKGIDNSDSFRLPDPLFPEILTQKDPRVLPLLDSWNR